MSKLGRVSRPVGFKPSSQAIAPRFEQRFGLVEGFLLLIIVLTPAACDSGDAEGWPGVNTSSPNPLVSVQMIAFSRDVGGGELDLVAIAEDGSGTEATLAGDLVLNEVYAGISSDGLVIIVRVNGATTELISINADGTGEILPASAPIPVASGEVFRGVTANGRVIFERVVGGFSNLYSIRADGSAAEVPLAASATIDETFGGIF